mmetsp:Transcript_20174/g.62729  ORF Transcript_20174/g.62729 Transcript_20174/m.62729 type:complete len:200 (+) Transcript_20174:1337-1936(+)
MRAVRQLKQLRDRIAEMLILVREWHARADTRDAHAVVVHASAQARVEQRRLALQVGREEEDGVGLLDAGDRRAERVRRAAVGEWAGGHVAVDGFRVKGVAQVLEREHRFDVGERAGERADARARRRLELLRDERECVLPRRGLKRHLWIGPDERCVEALALEAVVREACLVRDPLLVDILVEPWQDAHHLAAACVNADV